MPVQDRRNAGSGSEKAENTLIAEMASVLRANRINLDDERAVLIALHNDRFRSSDIVTLSDRAVDEARRAIAVEADPEWAKDRAWGGR